MYCVDASVIISAARLIEPYSERSKAFLDGIRAKHSKVFLPEILLLEVAAALIRATKDARFSFQFSRSLRRIEYFSFVPIDSRLTDSALKIIVDTGLRGPDAIYVALAVEYGLTLITLDEEQTEKGKKFANVQKP